MSDLKIDTKPFLTRDSSSIQEQLNNLPELTLNISKINIDKRARSNLISQLSNLETNLELEAVLKVKVLKESGKSQKPDIKLDELLGIDKVLSVKSQIGKFNEFASIANNFMAISKSVSDVGNAIKQAGNIDSVPIQTYVTALSKLNVAQSILTLSSQKLSAEKIKEILLTKGLTESDINAAMAKYGLTAANTATALSFKSLTQFIWANIAAMAKWLASNPLAWIPIAAGLIIALVKHLKSMEVTLADNQEKLSELKDEFHSIRSEIGSLESELEKVLSRIDEISKKRVRTASDETELKGLQQQNLLLERELEIKRKLEAIKGQEVTEQAAKTINTKSEKIAVKTEQSTYPDYYGMGEVPVYTTKSITRKEAVEHKLQQQEQIQVEYDALVAEQELLIRDKSTSKKKLDSIGKQIKNKENQLSSIEEFINKKTNELIEESKSLSDTDAASKQIREEIKNLTNKVIRANSGEYSAATDKFIELYDADSFAEAKTELGKLARAGTLSEETITSNEKYKSLIADTGLTAKKVCETITAYAANTKLPEMNFDITDYSQDIDDFQSSLDALVEAKEKLSSGNLNDSDVIDLMQSFPELIPYIDMTAESFGNLEQGLNDLISHSPDMLIEDLEELKENVNTEEEVIQIENLISALTELSENALQSQFEQMDFSSMTEGLNTIENDINGIVNAMDQLNNGTMLTKEELANLALQYPELLTASELFTTGSIDGQRDMLNEILSMAEQEYDAQIDKKIAELDATNELIQAQIDIEAQKHSVINEISNLSANDQLDYNTKLVQKIAELNELEGQNFVYLQGGILSVNEDSLNKQLNQEDSKGKSSESIWVEQQHLITDAYKYGGENGLKAITSMPSKFIKISEALNPILGKIQKKIADAFAGNKIDSSTGKDSKISTDLDGTGSEAKYKGNPGLEIDKMAINDWKKSQEEIIEAKIEQLQSTYTKNITAINNLASLKGIKLNKVTSGTTGKSNSGGSNTGNNNAGKTSGSGKKNQSKGTSDKDKKDLDKDQNKFIDSTSAEEEKLKKAIDKFAQSIKNINTHLNKYNIEFENANTFEDKITALKKILATQDKLRRTYEDEANFYDSEYKKIIKALPDNLSKKIEGTAAFDIEKYVDNLIKKGHKGKKEDLISDIVYATELWNKYSETMQKASISEQTLIKNKSELYDLEQSSLSAPLSKIQEKKQLLLNEKEDAETFNKEVTKAQYEDLIDFTKSEIEEWKKKQHRAEIERDEYADDTDQYQKLDEEANKYKDTIRSLIKEQYEYNKTMLLLPLEPLKKAKQLQEEELKIIQKKKKALTTAINAASKVLQDEIDLYQKSKDDTGKSYDEKINALLKEKEALSQVNEEKEQQLALEKAQYNYERALNQKTARIYREGEGFVYEADQSATKEALEEFDNIKYNQKLSEFDKQVAALEDAKEKAISAIDVQIQSLSSYKEEIDNIFSEFENILAMQELIQQFGSDSISKLLYGDRDLLETMKNSYFDAANKENSLENQIAKYEEAITKVEKIADTWDGSEEKITTAQANISKAISDSKPETEALDERIAKADELATEWTDTCLTLEDDLINITESHIEAKELEKEQLDERLLNIRAFAQEAQSLLSQIASALSEAKAKKAELDSINSQIDSNKGNAATVYSAKGQVKHDGLKSGLVNDSANSFEALTFRQLAMDEIPTILQAGEAVLTKAQQKTVLNNFNAISRMNQPDFLTPNFEKQTNNQNVNLTIEHISMPDVSNSEQFVKSLKNNLPSAFLQELNKN